MSANVSMILTAAARRADSEPSADPRKQPQQGPKGRISGTASHLNHVPDATCHIGGTAAGSGTAIATTTGRSGRNGPEVKNQNARDLEESMGSDKLDAKPDTRPSNNKKKTLLHTQASDRTPRPKQPGRFFSAENVLQLEGRRREVRSERSVEQPCERMTRSQCLSIRYTDRLITKPFSKPEMAAKMPAGYSSVCRSSAVPATTLASRMPMRSNFCSSMRGND